MYELIIVGGGPAGLSAAVYAARKKLNALLIAQDIGGQVNLTLGVENYLGYQFIEGPELIQKFETQVEQFPIEQKIGDKVLRLDKANGSFEAVSDSGERYQSKAVIYATGKRPRTLNVPGEAELTGRGVSYCAICDGPVFSGQRVAVIGGGNSAAEAVLDLVKIAEHVDMVSLTPLTCDPVLSEQFPRDGILSIYTEHGTERIHGEGLVEGIDIKDTKTGETKRLDVTGVFIEIGLVPNSDGVKDLLQLNRWGEIPITKACETEVSGLFAAGDVTDIPEKQIVIAAGEGAKAALQAHRYLQRLVE